MTTSIRISYGENVLNDEILSYFCEAFGNGEDNEACYEAVRDYVISRVDELLPFNLTWFPSLSEVYVELDGDPEGYQAEDDSRTVDELVADLATRAIEEADRMLEENENAFGPITKR